MEPKPTIIPHGFTASPSMLSCPVCHYVIDENWYFCPNCGKKLKTTPLSTSLSKQLQVYALSIFLPPFGIVPAIRYLLARETNAKIVGLICLILTILVCVLTIWSAEYFFSLIGTNATNVLNPLTGLQYQGSSSNDLNQLLNQTGGF